MIWASQLLEYTWRINIWYDSAVNIGLNPLTFLFFFFSPTFPQPVHRAMGFDRGGKVQVEHFLANSATVLCDKNTIDGPIQ